MQTIACSEAAFAVVDVETTGLNPHVDRVVEVACLRVRGGVVEERFSTLIDPGKPISPAASAIHGIYDRDVAGAPALDEVTPTLVRLARDAIVVGHNVRFDLGFLTCLTQMRSLCTLQLARRLVDAPDYRNETLRRVLELDVDVDAPAHRAATDAAVTAALLIALLRCHMRKTGQDSLPALLETTARAVPLERFTFGKYRNAHVRSIPTGYLRWIVDEGFENWPDVRHTALLELKQRRTLRPQCFE